MNVYDVGTVEEAKQIILTPIGDYTTDERWECESPYLLRLIEQSFNLDRHSVVLDYGCGIGRMAKALIDKYNCYVVGVDTSPSMRAHAIEYVASKKFSCCTHEDLRHHVGVYDAALAIWVLQHCENVERDITRIRDSLKPEAKCLVVNSYTRYIPTNGDWMDDGKDVLRMLGSRPEKLSSKHVGEELADTCYWTLFGE